jgi:hypothetical protein
MRTVSRTGARAAFITAVMVVVAPLAVPAYAAAGDLDTSFSGDGKVITAIGHGSEGAATAIQSDGKVLVLGLASEQSG